MEKQFQVISFLFDNNRGFLSKSINPPFTQEIKYFDDYEKRDDYLYDFMNRDDISEYRFYFDNGKRYDSIILFDEDDYDIAVIFVPIKQKKEFEEKYKKNNQFKLPWTPRDIKQLKPKPPIIRIIEKVCEKVTITRYLRSILYDDSKNLKIKRFEIYKNYNAETLGDIVKKIIVLKSNLTILKYSIKKEESNCTVQFYDNKTLVKDLPQFLNIQIKPLINAQYRIFIFCDKQTLFSSTNENFYQAAIAISSHGFDNTVKNILKYLNLPDSFPKPKIVIQKNKKFVIINSLDNFEDISTPLFAVWEKSTFDQIKNSFNSHIINETI